MAHDLSAYSLLSEKHYDGGLYLKNWRSIPGYAALTIGEVMKNARKAFGPQFLNKNTHILQVAVKVGRTYVYEVIAFNDDTGAVRRIYENVPDEELAGLLGEAVDDAVRFGGDDTMWPRDLRAAHRKYAVYPNFLRVAAIPRSSR